MGVVWTFFSLICPFSPLSPSLWETARYRLKYCLKGPLNPKQPTNIHVSRGWSGGAMVLGKLPVPGRPTYLDHSRARAHCACSRCGWGLFGHFFSCLSFLSSFSLWGGRVVRRCWVNFQCWGVLLTWITVGQGPIVLAVGAGGGCLDIFTLIYHLFSFSLSLGDGPI